MAAIFTFHCSCCGEVHEGSPSFSFKAPDQYASLSDEQKTQMAYLNDDLCTITHDEGVDHFIRAILEVQIWGAQDPFLWGVWVSVSTDSFNRYVETYHSPIEGDGFFGWLCNAIGLYPCHETRAADVLVQTDGTRPKVALHRQGGGSDRLVIDQRDGISIERAQRLAEKALHG